MATKNPAGPAGSATDVLGHYAAVVTTLVGIFVTLNTAVTTFARERVEHAAGFRAAVKVEEDYWAALYQQYVAVLAQPGQEERARSARLLAISELSTHEVPDFAEYSPGLFGGGDNQQKAAHAQLAGMQQSLQDALKNELTSGPIVARNAEYIIANKTEARPREQGRVTDVEQQAARDEIGSAATPGVSYATQTLAVGSPTGWDIDVFWCAGGPEAERYARATRVATELARLADAGYARRGFSVGRVRLRTLPQEQQAISGYASGVDVVLADSGAGEAAAAGELARLVGEGAHVPLKVATSLGSRTAWYLSVFVCAGTQASPTRSASAPEAAVATMAR